MVRPNELVQKLTLERERDFWQYQTTLTLTHHLGPGALFTRARDVQTGLPGESEWRGSRLAQRRERCCLFLLRIATQNFSQFS